jgi:hypothetical protein
MEFAGGTTIPKTGADPIVYNAEKHILTFRLTNSGDGWLVSFVEFLS